jgi:hypothetical protein
LLLLRNSNSTKILISMKKSSLITAIFIVILAIAACKILPKTDIKSPSKNTNFDSKSIFEIARINYTSTKITGEIGFKKFPKFTLPPNHNSVYSMPGRNQAMAARGDVFDWGFTQISTLLPNINNLPSSKKFYTMHGFPPKFSIDWAEAGINNDQKGAVTNKKEMWFDRVGNIDHNLRAACEDFRCLNCGTQNGGAGQVQNCCDSFVADFVQIDVENIFQRGFEGDIDQINLWNAMGFYFKKSFTYQKQKVKIGYFISNPVDQPWGFINENYNNAPSIFPFGYKTQRTTFGESRNMPKEIIGKEMKDWMDFGCKGIYMNEQDVLPNGTYKMANGSDYVLDHVKNKVNWLTEMLQYQEATRYKYPEFINEDGTHRNFGTFQLFVEDNDRMKYYPNPENSKLLAAHHYAADTPIPDEIVEGMVVFYKFSGGNSMVFWDYVPYVDITPNIGIKPVKNGGLNSEYFQNAWMNDAAKFNNKRIYSSVEAAIHANWRLFATEARPFFEGKSIYLNENTEVDYLDGNGYQKLNAVQLGKQGKIFVRAIVQNNQILIAAQKPYSDEKFQTKFRVRYKNWEQEFNYEGKFPKIWVAKF